MKDPFTQFGIDWDNPQESFNMFSLKEYLHDVTADSDIKNKEPMEKADALYALDRALFQLEVLPNSVNDKRLTEALKMLNAMRELYFGCKEGEL